MRLAEWLSRTGSNAVPSDDTPPRHATEALSALIAAVRSHNHDESDGKGLRPLVLAYCQQARDENLMPERMLVDLKHALDDALLGTSDEPTVREATRTRIVKLAIHAYYDRQA